MLQICVKYGIDTRLNNGKIKEMFRKKYQDGCVGAKDPFERNFSVF